MCIKRYLLFLFTRNYPGGIMNVSRNKKIK